MIQTLLILALVAVLVLAVLGALSIVTILRPQAPANTSTYPSYRAEGFAQAFASAYLTADPAKRATLLAGFEAPAADDSTGEWGWTPGTGSPQASAIDLYVAAYQQIDLSTARITVFALQEPGDRRVWLAIDVAVDSQGNLSVTQPPSFVPAVRGPQASGVSGQPSPQLDSQIRPTLRLLFTAYAASDQATLASIGTTADAIPGGLGGSVTLVDFQTVRGLACNGQESDCVVIVPVTWRTGDAGPQFTQPYKVHIINQARAWRVAALGPA